MEDNGYVVVIGSANIDIQGFSFNKLVMEDSNPGKIRISPGGVGRNIAENLAKLGVDIKLVTVLGDDLYNRVLSNDCANKGIDISHSLTVNSMSTPTYLSILEDNGDMKLAVCDAEALEMMDVNFIKSKHSVIENAAIVVIDTNLPLKTIEYIAINYRHKLLFVDTVSTQKSQKIKRLIECFDTIKLNLIEAKSLAGIELNSHCDLNKLSHFFIQGGVKNVFITLGKDGVHYRNNNYFGTLPSAEIKVISATGAGDAFMAALVYSKLKGLDIDCTVKLSIGAAILALSHEDTINPNLSLNNINRILKELKLC